MEVFVARQAIFDRSLNVAAYELLYRPSAGVPGGMRDDSLATCHVVSSTVFDIGVEKMLDGHRGFLNIPGDLLTDSRIESLPADVLGLEVLETTEPTPERLSSCQKLRSLGYVVSLDDFTGQKHLVPFLDVVDWVKVDYRVCRGPAPAGLGRKHLALRPKLVAEKVETEAELEVAMKAGYDYFQGYFLEKPKIVAGKRLSTGEAARLSLLKELSKPELDLRQLQGLIERDASLCYRLLKFANSARFANTSPITSVRHCLVQLGEIEVRRWIALTVLPELSAGRPRELVETAVIRARMCELLALKADLGNLASQAFLAGMFSLLDAILKRPISELADEMRFPDLLREVLVDRSSQCRLLAVLTASETFERADWTTAESLASQLNVEPSTLAEVYLNALTWARELRF